MSHLLSSNRIADWVDKVCGPSANADFNYTDLANAMAGLSAGQVLLVRAGTYNLSSDLELPNNGQMLIMERKSGGVVVDFGGGAYKVKNATHEARASDCAEAAATIGAGGTTVDWGTGHTTMEALVAAAPTSYSVIYCGKVYPIASFTGHAATLSTAIVAVLPAATAEVFVLKNDHPADIYMEGKLTLQNSTTDYLVAMTEATGFNWKNLDLHFLCGGTAASAIAFGCSDCDFGHWIAEGVLLNGPAGFIFGGPHDNLRGRWTIQACAYNVGAAAVTCRPNYLGAAVADSFSRGVSLDVNIRGNVPIGSQANIAMDALAAETSAERYSLIGNAYGNRGKGSGTPNDFRYTTGKGSYGSLGYGVATAI